MAALGGVLQVVLKRKPHLHEHWERCIGLLAPMTRERRGEEGRLVTVPCRLVECLQLPCLADSSSSSSFSVVQWRSVERK